MHNLPVHPFSNAILQYVSNAYPNFSKELHDEIMYTGLDPTIIYDNSKSEIRCAAEIRDNHQIIVYENYIAFLWCMTFATVTLINAKNSEENELDNIIAAFSVLEYGFSLKYNWAEWPNELPDPTMSDNKNVDNANSITVIAMSYIVAHEIGHHFLGHEFVGYQNDNEIREDEFAADNFAFEVIIGGYIEGDDIKNNSINVGIITGFGSLLLLEDTWEESETHPDIEVRFQRILQRIQNSNGNVEDYWHYGSIILAFWEALYKNNDDNFFTDELLFIEKSSHKAGYIEIMKRLREKQRNF